MGFWAIAGKTVLSFGKEFFDKSRETLNEAQELSQKYSNESSSFLEEKAKSGKPAQMIAAKKVLKNRGEILET